MSNASEQNCSEGELERNCPQDAEEQNFTQETSDERNEFAGSEDLEEQPETEQSEEQHESEQFEKLHGIDEFEGNQETLQDQELQHRNRAIHFLPEGAEELTNTGEVAEVVLVGTTLGSIRRQFFATKRLQNFFDCKGIVYVLIDCNRDTSTAMNLLDLELFQEWKAQGILKAENSDGTEVVIPQVLVDGVAIGGETDIQDFEEDGDLDWILSRAACPSCLQEKAPSSGECSYCGTSFTQLISTELIEKKQVQQILQGYAYSLSACEGEQTELKTRWASESKLAEVEFDET